MIFLTGHHATGKTVVAEVLKAHDYPVIDTGPLMRAAHQAQAPGGSFGEWVRWGESHYGPRFTDDVLLEAARPTLVQAAALGRTAVVVGHRSLSGIRYFQKHAFGRPVAARIMYIDAPVHLLHLRWMEREGRSLSLADFTTLLAKDREMGVEGIRTEADWVIVNDGRLDTFTRTVLSCVTGR